jgi:PEP-CTERM motif
MRGLFYTVALATLALVTTSSAAFAALRVDTPEPATGLILLIGAGGGLLARRFRRRQ